ncbi:MAG TPA: hypothetical protein PL009_06950 [Flavipsychrobacter sp.]|nr:hypothetical protein [Flavipsychrobacter sp.]
MRIYFLITSVLLFFTTVRLQAQTKIDTVSNFLIDVPVKRKLYVGNGLDFAMLSTAFVSKPGSGKKITTPRVTAIVNFGFTFHYDLTNKLGLMSGVGLRNMGFIEKENDWTIKRRVYSLGIPFGIKFGDLRNRTFVFGGAGIDLPFHYKEKVFKNRSNKEKHGEWFGDQTPRILPFVFIGHSWDPGITVKFQYYPTNFVNENYAVEKPLTVHPPAYDYPFDGYEVNLFLLSLGIDIHYGKYKMHERGYQEMKKEREQNKVM